MRKSTSFKIFIFRMDRSFCEEFSIRMASFFKTSTLPNHQTTEKCSMRHFAMTGTFLIRRLSIICAYR